MQAELGALDPLRETHAERGCEAVMMAAQILPRERHVLAHQQLVGIDTSERDAQAMVGGRRDETRCHEIVHAIRIAGGEWRGDELASGVRCEDGKGPQAAEGMGHLVDQRASELPAIER